MLSQTLLPTGAEKVGEIQAAEHLGIGFDEPRGVALLHAPLSIFRTEANGQIRLDVAVEHDPFTGKDLVGFLKTVAPSPIQGPYGILADWGILEERGGFFAKRLLELHEPLGNAWGEFAESQPAFSETLEEEKTPDFRGIANLNLTPAKKEGDLLLESNLVKLGTDDFGRLVEKLQILDVDITAYVYGSIAQSMSRGRGPQGRIKDGEDTRPTLYDYFSGLTSAQRKKLIRHSLRAIGPANRVSAFRQLHPDMYDRVTVNEQEFIFPRDRMAEGASLQEAFDNRQAVEQENFEAEFMHIPLQDGSTGVVAIQGSRRRIREHEHTLRPLVSWNSALSGRRSRSFNIERHSDEETGIHHDGVLGVLVVAYFAPEIRETWPERMGLPGSDFKQRMSEAQVPVLALLRSSQLLDSEFVEKVEDLAA